MPAVNGRDLRVCPTCKLALTILQTDDGPVVEYDVAEWTRLCRHLGRGSPLVCPNLEPLIRDWLRRP
jgi:hypothetical protein